MNSVMSLGKSLLKKIRAGVKIVAVKSKGCQLLLFLSTTILITTAIALLFYALYWRSGNLIDLPTIKIGFYNICLWNENSHSLHCYQFPELEAMGVSQVGIALARFGVYSAFVLVVFAFLPLVLPWCSGNKDSWKLVIMFLGISAALLLSGLLLFLYYTTEWIQPWKLGTEFLALVGAEIIVLLILLIVSYPLGYEVGWPEHQETKT